MGSPDRVEMVHVVIPAHDEEALLPACLGTVTSAMATLRALRADLQVGLTVVLDACSDRSLDVCRAAGVDVVVCTERNVGAARAVGVGRARALAAAVGVAPRATWIASTDADSTVPPRWLLDHVDLAEGGTDVLLGRVEPDGTAAAPVLDRWHTLHPQELVSVHGAHLGFRLDRHDLAGGWAPLDEHEDVDLVRRMLATGGRLGRAREVVTTSSRPVGRTAGGFAGFIAGLAREVAGDGDRPGATR